MKIAIFKLIDNVYFGKDYLDENAWLLSSFLTDDVGCYGATFKEFIKNANEKQSGGNFSWLLKKGDNILIGCEWAENPAENYMTISQK